MHWQMKFTNKTTKTFISSIPSFRQIKNENENDSEDDWTIEWENGKQTRHSKVLFGVEDETKRNEWLKEKHGFNEVHLNQQILSNEELTILMIVKVVSMTIRKIWKI